MQFVKISDEKVKEKTGKTWAAWPRPMDTKLPKKIILRFRAENRDIFDAIYTGRKKVETRAASSNYNEIKPGDTIVFVCGKERFERKAAKVSYFKNIEEMLAKYKPEEIHPAVSSAKELEDIYDSFPDYLEKIREFGLVAIELEK